MDLNINRTRSSSGEEGYFEYSASDLESKRLLEHIMNGRSLFDETVEFEKELWLMARAHGWGLAIKFEKDTGETRNRYRTA